MRSPRFLILALVVSATGASAQMPETLDLDAVRRNNPMPDAARIEEVQRAMRPEIERALNAPIVRPTLPDFSAQSAPMPARGAEGTRLPMLPPHVEKTFKMPPQNGFLDPALMNRAMNAVNQAPPTNDEAEFKVFVSFSIPAKELKSIIENAAAARATVVFRGPADENDMALQRFARKLKALGVKYNRDIEIDPPSFQKYQVTEVPTYVLAERTAATREVEGCAPAGSYARVTGNVAPEFALNVIKSRAEAKIAALASTQLDRMEREREARR